MAVAILQKFDSDMMTRWAPLSIYGDGNCAFRAVSLALFRTENLHEYVRLMTALEMIDHQLHYDVSSPTYSGALQDDRVLTPPYTQLLYDVTKIGTPITLMHIYAIGSAFGCVIKSYIPPTVSVGLGNSSYSVTVVGRNVQGQADVRVTLMWTMMSVPRDTDPYDASHIILLAPKVTANIGDRGEECNFEETDNVVDKDPDATSWCIVCTRQVTARQYAVDCDFCGVWCHIRCQKGMVLCIGLYKVLYMFCHYTSVNDTASVH